MKKISYIVILVVLLIILMCGPQTAQATPFAIADSQFFSTEVGFFVGGLGAVALFLIIYLVRSFFKKGNRISSHHNEKQ